MQSILFGLIRPHRFNQIAFNYDETKNLMTICSLVIHARPEKLDVVSGQLESMKGVEVFGRDELGKLVVVIDHPERLYCSEAMMNMAKMDHVVSTSLVYEHADPD